MRWRRELDCDSTRRTQGFFAPPDASLDEEESRHVPRYLEQTLDSANHRRISVELTSRRMQRWRHQGLVADGTCCARIGAHDGNRHTWFPRLGVTGMNDVGPVALVGAAGMLMWMESRRRRRTRERGPKASPWFEHLVFLSATQDPQADASVDRSRLAMLLEGELRGALDAAAIDAAICVQFNPSGLTARIDTADATRAFNTVAPVFRASSYCAGGYVLLRYGPPGARERQVKLSDVPGG